MLTLLVIERELEAAHYCKPRLDNLRLRLSPVHAKISYNDAMFHAGNVHSEPNFVVIDQFVWGLYKDVLPNVMNALAVETTDTALGGH